MKCQGPYCGGETLGLRCSDHGTLCSECGFPTSHIRADKRCGRCGGRQDGVKCASCESPWIYLPYYEDGKWRCRMCVSQIIAENDWMDEEQGLKDRLKEQEEERKKKEQEALKEREEIEERLSRLRKRGSQKHKQNEGLFDSEDPKDEA
jgi:hypothetical protein